MTQPVSIARPLVRTNQWVIVIAVLSTWLTHHEWILLLPLVSGVLGLVFHFNPIMRLARLFLRKPAKEYAQEDRDQQNFNQAIAVACLTLGFLSYLTHIMIAAYIFTALVATAAFVAILGFCIGCFIRFQWNQYRYRRRSLKMSQ